MDIQKFELNCDDITVANIIAFYENEGLCFEINDGHIFIVQ